IASTPLLGLVRGLSRRPSCPLGDVSCYSPWLVFFHPVQAASRPTTATKTCRHLAAFPPPISTSCPCKPATSTSKSLFSQLGSGRALCLTSSFTIRQTSRKTPTKRPILSTAESRSQRYPEVQPVRAAGARTTSETAASGASRRQFHTKLATTIP